MLERIKDKIFDFQEQEQRTIYSVQFKFQAAQALEYSEWLYIICKVPLRDEVRIFLKSESDDTLIINRISTEEKYNEFIENTLEDEDISVKIEINKSFQEGHFSVYRFNKFSEDITRLPVEEVLNIFSLFLKKVSNTIVFELFDNTNVFYTKSMYFLPVGNNEIHSTFNRRQRLLECRDVSCFYNQETYELLPDDFKIEVGYERNPFSELFLKLETFLAASMIASNAMLQAGNIKLQIMGQRSVDYVFSLNEIIGNPILYKIYDWIYSGGSSIDKAIIARNIICLHCKYEPLLKLDSKVLLSIQSSYNLYLKDHVIQYLEMKNKIAEFISEILSRTGEYATELLDKFKTNMIAVFGFLFTVILADIVSDQPLDNIFTRDITVILELVLLGSVIYLFICYRQSKYQMEKVYESYESLKQSYEGILTEDDIRECFQNDQLIVNMKNTVNRSEKKYLILWIAFLIGILIVLEMISDGSVILPIIKTVVHRLKVVK